MFEEQRLYEQWRNANENVKYPFSARALLTNGYVILPEQTFLDARVYPSGGTSTMFLSRITKTADSIELAVADTVSGELATAFLYTADILTQNIELLELQDKYGRVAGVLVTEPDRIGLLTALPIGTHEFSLEQTEFAASVITPMPQSGLRSLVVDDEPLYGDVWLVGGLGVVLTHRIGDLYGDHIVTINIVGEPLSKRVICQNAGTGEFDAGRFLEYLVVLGSPIRHDEYGDIKIGVCGMDVDDTVLRVLPSSNGIIFSAVGGRIGNVST